MLQLKSIYSITSGKIHKTCIYKLLKFFVYLICLKIKIMWHMGPFYNNIGMPVNILTATNPGSNRTAVSMRRSVNTPT
jgi:hypothetical protein